VEVVEAIARRHRGEPVALPPEAWTRLAGLRRPLALRLLAHAVQGANDAAAPNWREVAARALEQLRAPGEEDEGDARVLGALGRLHAGWGEWAAGAALLERSLATWRALRRPSEMSFSACELLRVTGIAGEGPAVERAIAHAEACREHDDTSQVSRDYLDLALGRARVQRGLRGADRAQVQRGLRDLTRISAGSPVRGAALRWMAIAGNDDALRALDAHTGQDERRALDALLARLARGPAPDDWRARLAGHAAAELERARSVLGPDAAPDAVAAIWRY
jgi:hypothetical protein